jgi:hypothetical protein
MLATRSGISSDRRGCFMAGNRAAKLGPAGRLLKTYQYNGDPAGKFNISDGNAEIEGIQVTLDYNRPNDPKVLFEIKI